MPYYRGVADSGPEFGGTFPGTYAVDYHYDGLGTLQYFAGRGHKIIRLPFSWERIQPTRNAALDATELGRLTTYLSNAQAAGVKVILDVHNFTRYITSGGTTLVMYTDFPDSDLVDLWTKLSAALRNTPAVYAYELMNEPHDLPALFVPQTTIYDFENGTTPAWGFNGGSTPSFANSTAQAHSGTHSLAVSATLPAGGFQDVRPRDRAHTYVKTDGVTLSVWVYVPVGSPGTNWLGHLQLFPDIASDVSITPGVWTQLTLTPSDTGWSTLDGLLIQVGATSTGGPVTVYVDDVQQGAFTQGAQRWQATAQSVLNAIRANNDNTLVMVDGYGFASATAWTTNHPTPWLTDSAKNFCYVAHHYCGTNQSGNFKTFAQENSDAIGRGYTGLQDQAVQRLQVFTDWLAANNVRGAVTEIAWRGDESSASWNAVGTAMYAELNAKACDVTYWGNGEWWPALASSNPAWYGAYTNGTGGGTSAVSVANPQTTVIEANLSATSPGGARISDVALGVAVVSDSALA